MSAQKRKSLKIRQARLQFPLGRGLFLFFITAGLLFLMAGPVSGISPQESQVVKEGVPYQGASHTGKGVGPGTTHPTGSKGPASQWGPEQDREMKRAVMRELQEDPFVDSEKVSVTVREGLVILEGTVESWTEHAAATADAFQAGARGVENRLKVREGPIFAEKSGV